MIAKLAVLRLDQFPALAEQFIESPLQTIGDKCRAV